MKYISQYIYITIVLVLPSTFVSQTASFSSNVNSGCLPLVVNFSNTSINALSYD